MAEAGKVVKGGVRKAIAAFFEYDTPKIVHIRSKTVGTINRLIQIAILTYIIGYAIIYEKGYQETDSVESSTTTKLKGVAYINSTRLNISSIPGVTDRVWDVADYVVPPQENDAFFVTTNVVVTEGQVQGTCPEDSTMQNVNCTKNSDCPAGEPVVNGNGVRTGVCDTDTNTCMIYAWCPVEIDDLPLPNGTLFAEAKYFTVLIKNSIEFPKFNVHRRNILESQDPDYLKKCHYDSKSEEDRLCPIFPLGTIVSEAKQNFDSIAVKGGVIAINIKWDCNLDHSIEKCKPEYSFSRLDLKEAKISPGLNFRYANYYHENNTSKRDLVKAYGLRFVIKVSGEAGKFSIVPLLLNLGSGLGLLAIATVLCDIIVLYILRKGPFYQDKKYLTVVDDDAFHTLSNSMDTESNTERQPQLNPDSDSSSPTHDYQATGSTPQGITNRGPRVGQYTHIDDDDK